jgi:pSer/pThr/pTyr-binding forkhead associated (FHA) protein
MSIIPRTRDINRIEGCTADKFDEEYLRTIKGQGFSSGYFYYPDGPVKRYLLVDEGLPQSAAWDDGSDGRATSLNEFFEPFLKAPQELTFCQADSQLTTFLAVSWQQRPDAHTSPGVIDAAEMIKSLLRRNREFIVRLRRDAHTSFLNIGAGKILSFYFDTHRFKEGDAETRLVHELTANHAFLSIDVWENQEAGKAEDWALVPNDFQEGMIRFYCCSAPHLILLLGGKEIRRVPLQPGSKIIIGREPTVELVVDNLSVSRRHAAVEFRHGECRIEDLGSKNGTYLNGERISGTAVLDDCQEITLGKHSVRFVRRAMIQERSMVDMSMLDRTIVVNASQFTQATAEQPKTAVMSLNGKLHQIKRTPYSIGSAETANLLINDVGVKGVHAVMEKDTSGQWWISHRGGMLASTRINGRKVKTAPLRSGDLVQLGNVMLRFQLIEEAL